MDEEKKRGGGAKERGHLQIAPGERREKQGVAMVIDTLVAKCDCAHVN